MTSWMRALYDHDRRAVRERWLSRMAWLAVGMTLGFFGGVAAVLALLTGMA